MKTNHIICKEWLGKEGFEEIFSNHPLSEVREVHFTKDNIRVKCFFTHKELMHCQLQSTISYKPILHIVSIKYDIKDDEVFEVHRRISEYIKKLTDEK